MSATETIAERVDALERRVAELQARIGRIDAASDWLQRVAGSMENEPLFDEVLKLGREIREADRPDDLDEAEA